MSRFHLDDDLQKRVRDAVIGPGFYGPFSMDGRYVFLDKGRLATDLQKRFAVDTILQGRKGDAVCIEEKIVRWPGYAYDAITLETMSCTVPGRESDGWMRYGKADWINYAMCQEDGNVLCYLISFPALQEAFWPAHQSFRETTTDQHNRTTCRIVPLDWIRAKVGLHPTNGRMVHADPDGAEIVKAYNATHYRRASEMAVA